MWFLKLLKFSILVSLFVFSNKFTCAQTYEVITYKTWAPSGVGYWTRGYYYNIYNDFDWMLTRSTETINGYYYFDFWFFSQSYYWDGYTPEYASTNIRNIDVYVDGRYYKSDYSTIGITFLKTYNAQSLRIITKNPRPTIYFKWGNMKAN